jgi:hypothetical protein
MHFRHVVWLSALSLLCGCSLHLDRDTELDSGRHIGSIYQVDGSINLAAGGTARNLSTVSAAITLQQGAQAGRIRTVDGSIDLEPHATARGDVMSVDGSIRIARSAQVLGKVQTLTGAITMDDAFVDNGIEIVSGKLMISGASLVNRGIYMRKPTPREHGDDLKRLPTIIIGPHAKIAGDITSERGGDVWVSRSAQIGRVQGVHIHWFDGASPHES